MDFEKCNHKVPEAPAPSPAVDPAEVARDDFTEYYMKEFGHPGLTPKKYQTIASYGVEFHGKNEVLDARFKYEGYNYPAPAPDYSERPHRMDVNYYLHKNSNSGPGERIGQYDSWRELLSAAQRWFKTEPGTLYYFSPSGDGELRRSDVERQLEKSTIPAPAPSSRNGLPELKQRTTLRILSELRGQEATAVEAYERAIKAFSGLLKRYDLVAKMRYIRDEEMAHRQILEGLISGGNEGDWPAPSPLPKCSGGDAQDG